MLVGELITETAEEFAEISVLPHLATASGPEDTRVTRREIRLGHGELRLVLQCFLIN